MSNRWIRIIKKPISNPTPDRPDFWMIRSPLQMIENNILIPSWPVLMEDGRLVIAAVALDRSIWIKESDAGPIPPRD